MSKAFQDAFDATKPAADRLIRDTGDLPHINVDAMDPEKWAWRELAERRQDRDAEDYERRQRQ